MPCAYAGVVAVSLTLTITCLPHSPASLRSCEELGPARLKQKSLMQVLSPLPSCRPLPCISPLLYIPAQFRGAGADASEAEVADAGAVLVPRSGGGGGSELGPGGCADQDTSTGAGHQQQRRGGCRDREGVEVGVTGSGGKQCRRFSGRVFRVAGGHVVVRALSEEAEPTRCRLIPQSRCSTSALHSPPLTPAFPRRDGCPISQVASALSSATSKPQCYQYTSAGLSCLLLCSLLWLPSRSFPS